MIRVVAGERDAAGERAEDLDDARFIPIGVIVRPHGLAGELRLKLFNPDSTLLRAPMSVLVQLDGTTEPAEVLTTRSVAGGLLLRLGGVADRDTAERLRGAQLGVLRSQLAQPLADEYYVCDLEGCEVRLDGRGLGVVRAVTSYPTCDLLLIERPGAENLEVPLHEDYILEVRLAERLILLRATALGWSAADTTEG